MYDTKTQKELVNESKQLIEDGSIIKDIKIARELANQLTKIIVYHEWRYYVKNDPVISDFEYDTLFKRLEKLEADFPEIIHANSPTQRVSNDLISDFDTVPHLTPMLSLANSYNAEDLKEFDEQIRKLLNLDELSPIEYVVEPKFDGGSIALVYDKNKLIRASTRGNGQAGEEITNNARVMRSVPLTADFAAQGMAKVELRGEVVIRKSVFEKMNTEREKAGQTLFANPRNTASGGLRMKDPKEVDKRGLEAFIYQIGYAVDESEKNVLKSVKSQNGSIELLGQLGFKVPTIERKLCQNIEEVADFCKFWEEKRESYEYEIDGMVVKVNDLEYQERSGFTSHHPRWAIAYKFKAKQATSKLLGVEYQVGKIGSVTPVAKIQPVQLAGVTVSSISLHNADFISGKDIRIGDTVLVERAGDVIPYIVKSMEDLRDGTELPIEFPTQCPVCSSVLIRAENESAWRCENYNCEAQVIQRMIHHVSKDAMNIDGFGKSYIERFHAEGWLTDISDIYHLDFEKISTLEGFGTRSAEKLEKAISKARSNPIHRLLNSLAIHHLGRKVSKLLAAEIKHVLDLKDWTEENFTEIKDVGPIVAENVIAFFQSQENVELLQRLEDRGVNLKQTEADLPKVVNADAAFFGKTILFTGSLKRMSRKEAQAKAENAGAKNISAVSSNLNILVVGEKAGSKLKKAQALETVTILTEDEFIAMIEST